MIIGNRTPVGITPSGLAVPSEFTLSQNYPNPFNPVTNIKFGISKLPKGQVEFVTLKVFDLQGKEVAELLNENKFPGNYVVEFDGENFPSGTYFYKLTAGQFSETRRMILLK